MKRYDMANAGWPDEPQMQMIENPDGEWVKWSDVQGTEMWMVLAMTEEYGMVYLPQYGGTRIEVEGEVMEGARREGFRGTLKERLDALGWEIVRGRFTVTPGP